MRTFITAEIGINHGGSIDTALQLIDAAIYAGCDAVKFQKRTIDICYTPEELAQPRQSPFGNTNGDLKRALEFGQNEYEIINAYCKDKIIWYASPWDMPSVDFLEQFNPEYYKIPSARNTDLSLLNYVGSKNRKVIVSLAMAKPSDISRVIHRLYPNYIILMVCTATYPAKLEELNLSRIERIKKIYPLIPVGYSGHEVGLYSSLCAVAMGATYLERHITLDRSSFGSDQSASIEPIGFKKLVREVRDFEIALGSPVFGMLESEKPVALKLRRP